MNENNWTTLYAAVAKIKYTKANIQKYDLPKEIKKKIINKKTEIIIWKNSTVVINRLDSNAD